MGISRLIHHIEIFQLTSSLAGVETGFVVSVFILIYLDISVFTQNEPFQC